MNTEDIRKTWLTHCIDETKRLGEYDPTIEEIADWWIDKCIPKATLEKFVKDNLIISSQGFEDWERGYNSALYDLKRILLTESK